MRLFRVVSVLALFLPVAAAAQPRVTLPERQPFLGGVPSGTPSRDTLSLDILDAIRRGPDHNLGLLLSNHAADRAMAVRRTALADLLPTVSGQVGETRQIVNLAAFGFPLPAGIPPLVGPFNVFDARLHLSQAVYDA